MNEEIVRHKKEEVQKTDPAKEVVYSLECKLEKYTEDTSTEERYAFSGSVQGNKMDTDLMSTVLAKIVKQSVPMRSIPTVMELVLKKLDLLDED